VQPIPLQDPGRTDRRGSRTRDRRARSRAAIGLAAAAVLLASGTIGCTSSDGGDQAAAISNTDQAARSGVTGPLCDLLPVGTEPGNPASLASEPVDVTLQWIPVLTTFEAAMRASGMLPELSGMPGITILAPTDDAFGAKFSGDNLDELMIKNKDQLRTLLKAHIVDKPLALAELVDAGTVTTLDGSTVTITRAETMARIGEEAQTVCADYRIANGRIHVINHVLGNLPTTAGKGGDPGH
jgi:uncharacterized surface protein with fasciclin (FAS1) repeats